MKRLGSLLELAKITGGTWAGEDDPQSLRRSGFAGVAIDSRQLRPGEVFFCLRGTTSDGHRFARAAARAGAAAVVVRRRRAGFTKAIKGVPVLRVNDPVTALGDWAGAFRRRFDLSFTAVTGSVGKTSTKEMIAAILQQKYVTFKSPGNYNNLLGIPLALQDLKRRHQRGVVELGMSSPGEIARLTEIIDPQIGVITWIGPAHLEFFADVNRIARAKRELFDQMDQQGTGVVNIDNPILARWRRRLKRSIVGYSIRRPADTYATDICLGPGETVFRLNGRTLIKLPVIGKHAVSNALAACAVARLYGIGVEKIRRGLQRMVPPAGRLEITKTKTITIIDDTYNSNPISAIAALETLCALRSPGRRIACLGAMRELGVSARQHHRDVGRAAAARGVDILVGVGSWGREIVAGAREAKRGIKLFLVPDVRQATKWLAGFVGQDDVVLIKASRAEGFDDLVIALQKLPKQNER